MLDALYTYMYIPMIYRWFEQDAEELLESVRQCLEKVGEMLGEEGVKRLRGVGITNQRETTIVWDKTTGKPLYNAIGIYMYTYSISYTLHQLQK